MTIKLILVEKKFLSTYLYSLYTLYNVHGEERSEVRATFWSSKLSTPRSHRRWFFMVAILRSRSFTQAGPWIIATQPARNELARRDLGF